MTTSKRVVSTITIIVIAILVFVAWKTIFHDTNQHEKQNAVHAQKCPQNPTIIIPGTQLVPTSVKNTVFHEDDPFHIYTHFVGPDHYVCGVPVTAEGYELSYLGPYEKGYAVKVPIRAY